MGKAEQTRTKIIHQAAVLFNQRGYSGISISDIMQATDLEKGGIYSHFASKDEIALASFDYAYARQSERYAEVLKTMRGQSTRQLHAMVDIFTEGYRDPVIAGGCVIMNTAIESDNAHPALKARAAAAMDDWRCLIERIVVKGIERGEFRPETDVAALASLLIASLEGGQMMSRLYGDPLYSTHVADHLHSYIDQNVVI